MNSAFLTHPQSINCPIKCDWEGHWGSAIKAGLFANTPGVNGRNVKAESYPDE